MVLVIDPGIRILDDNHQVFVLHPGDRKRFYRDFIENEAVFLDLPGLAFAEPPDIENETLRNSLRMSRRISIWRRRGSPAADRPSRDASEYAITNPGMEAPRFVREVKDLYTDAKAGDLVVVPGSGYRSTVYIGEFLNDFDPEFVVQSNRYPTETIPARRVKWLPVRVAKGQFPERIIRLLQNRQAIIRITQRDDRHQIYEFAYGDYVWGDVSGNLIKVGKDHVDLNELSRAVDLTNFFAAQYLALKKNELGQFLELPFQEAIDRYYDKAYFGSVSVEIHSPGYFLRPMHSAALAGYVSVMLALSAAQVAPGEAAQAVVENSANATTSICDEQLEADIRETMEMYANIHLWEQKVCPLRQRTEAEVGLDTDVKVMKREEARR